MALSALTVEILARWCLENQSMADVRAKALGEFFGYDELGTVNYWEGTGDPISKERRFMGWFSYSFRMNSGQHLAALAATNLLKESEASYACNSIEKARYIFGVVGMIIPGKGFYLELEDEEFEISSKYLSGVFHKEETICAYILPVGFKRWVAGPGWITWPMHLGEGMRANLKQMQMTPIEVERFLQRRSNRTEKPVRDHPRDKTLVEAVNRMTEAAQSAGFIKLIRSVEEWKLLIVGMMKSAKTTALSENIVQSIDSRGSIEEINKWLALGSNIWNNVPQPDRNNKSANDLVAEYARKAE